METSVSTRDIRLERGQTFRQPRDSGPRVLYRLGSRTFFTEETNNYNHIMYLSDESKCASAFCDMNKL